MDNDNTIHIIRRNGLFLQSTEDGGVWTDNPITCLEFSTEDEARREVEKMGVDVEGAEVVAVMVQRSGG